MESFFTAIARVLNAWYSVVYSLMNWLSILFGIFPKSGKYPAYVYQIIHYTFIVGMTAILGWKSLNWFPEASFESSRLLGSYWFVRQYFAAIIFLLGYLFVRFLIVAYQIFMSRDLSEFEDITAAWEAGLDSLAREGFDLQWLPIFLVNGATAEQMKSLTESSQIPWKVTPATEEARSAALTFYACDEALFISLNDVGAMSRQLKKGNSRAASAAAKGESAVASTMRPDQIRSAIGQTRRPDEQPGAGGQTLPPGAVAKAALGATMPPPRQQAQYGATMRPGEILQSAIEQSAVSRNATPPAVLEKLGKEELNVNRRRMQYFCQLLSTERGSFCPCNGLLQVIPLRWTQSAAFEPLSAAAAQDVQTLHDELHLQFPVVCLHSGLEELTGLTEFVERGKKIDSRFRDSRAGSRYPGGLVIDEKSSSWVVERGLVWFRDWVYEEFAKDLANPKNRQLYQFLCSLSLRRDRLIREIRSVMGELKLHLPVRMTGCYFAATGPETSKQAFVHGVMQRLMSEQNDVAWQPEWRARDRRCLWLTGILSLVAIGLIAFDGYIAWSIWNLFDARS